MRSRLVSLVVTFAVVLGIATVARQERAADAEQMPFAKLSGRELVERLMGEKERSRAFYELWRRSEPGTDEGFGEFEEGHYDPRVVVCPQQKGEPPIYIVLCGFLGRSSTDPSEGYVVEKPDDLFPSSPGPSWMPTHKPLIEAFTADG